MGSRKSFNFFVYGGLIAFFLIFFPIVKCLADETELLDQLIQTTTRQLHVQKEIKDLMESYRYQCDLFEKGKQTKAQVLRMVTTASQILTKITENHLQQLFSAAYLEELALFSSIAAKRAPGRP
jgi:hypothetical protein